MSQHSSFPAGWEVLVGRPNRKSHCKRSRNSHPANIHPFGCEPRSNRSASVCWFAVWQSHHFYADGGRRPSNLRFASGFQGRRRSLPGQQTNSSVRLTNIGTTSASYDYALSVLSGPCTAALLSYTSTIDVDVSQDLPFQVDVGTTASVGDVCALRLTRRLLRTAAFPSSEISRLRSTEKYLCPSRPEWANCAGSINRNNAGGSCVQYWNRNRDLLLQITATPRLRFHLFSMFFLGFC